MKEGEMLEIDTFLLIKVLFETSQFLKIQFFDTASDRSVSCPVYNKQISSFYETKNLVQPRHWLTRDEFLKR